MSEVSPTIDEGQFFPTEVSIKLEKPPNIKTDDVTFIDKPFLLACDSSRKQRTSPEISPESNQAFDKPHVSAADSSRRFETLQDIMPEIIRRRRSITVKEKLDILNMVDSGQKLSAVAREFGISSSTASTIVKERHKIKMLADHYNIDPERKRMRLGIYRDVDEAVHMWFRQMRMKNIPINGPMLQQKAREFAVQLGHQNFEGSSGWLFRFRERHGLSVKTMRDPDENNIYNCGGVGMTDDEIVTSVCQNTIHPLNFCDTKDNVKDKNNIKGAKKSKVFNSIEKPDIPENYFVPEIELTDYDQSVALIGLPEAIALADKLTSFLKGQNVPSDILKSMDTVSDFIDKDLRQQMKQRKITDYFKP